MELQITLNAGLSPKFLMRAAQFLFEGQTASQAHCKGICGPFENGHQIVWNRCLGREVCRRQCEDNL